MTTLHRIGSRLYNFAAVAELNVEPHSMNRPRRPGPCVEVISTVGHVRYVTGEAAEALIEYLEGRSKVADVRPIGHAALAIATVSAPEPESAEDPTLAVGEYKALLAAVECQAAIDRYSADPKPDPVPMTDVLGRHGWAGGNLPDARDFVRRMIADADLKAHAAEATATA